MKRLVSITGMIFLLFVFFSCEKNFTEDPLNSIELKSGKHKNKGFDKWGFNWNAHHFNGSFYNVLLGDHMYSWAPWYKTPPYLGVDNIFDKAYASQILINAPGFGGNAPRYYYPGNPINYYTGININYNF